MIFLKIKYNIKQVQKIWQSDITPFGITMSYILSRYKGL